MNTIKNQKELDEAIGKVLRYSSFSGLLNKNVKEITHTSHVEEEYLDERYSEYFGDNRIKLKVTVKISISDKVVHCLNISHIVKDREHIEFAEDYIFQEMYDEFMTFVCHTLSESFVKEEV